MRGERCDRCDVYLVEPTADVSSLMSVRLLGRPRRHVRRHGRRYAHDHHHCLRISPRLSVIVTLSYVYVRVCVWLAVEYEDPKQLSHHRVKKITYPPRLMVDFTSLGVRSFTLSFALSLDTSACENSHDCPSVFRLFELITTCRLCNSVDGSAQALCAVLQHRCP